MANEYLKQYELRTRAGERAIRRGHYGMAARHFRSALAEAVRLDDANRQDKARLNLNTALLHRGEVVEAERGLREIVMRSSDDVVIGAACYILASCLRKQGKHEKALRYARRALEKRRVGGDPALLGNYHNLIANIELGQGHLTEALEGYQRALDMYGEASGDTRFLTAIAKENFGYCLLLMGDYERGLSELDGALAIARDVGHERTVAECHQDLSFGLMKAGKLELAEHHALRALQLGRRRRYRDILKNSYYLLGEISLLRGDQEASDRYFSLLSRFYPSVPFLREFLQAVDISNILSLRT